MVENMLFSERQRLEKEYYKWIKEASDNLNVSIKDCPSNVIAFLSTKGLLKK